MLARIMKILQVVHNFLPYSKAGTEIYTHNLSLALAQRGHRVSIFHRCCNLKKREYELTRKKKGGQEIFCLNNTFSLCDSFEMTYKNGIIAEAFARVLDDSKPDIVHIQHLLYLSAEIIKEIVKRGIPVVFTLHDYWLACPQGQFLKSNEKPCHGEDAIECVKCVAYQLGIRKNSFKLYYFLRRYIPEYLVQCAKRCYLVFSSFSIRKKGASLISGRASYMRKIFSGIDMFIAPSKFFKQAFAGFGIPEEKIIFLPHGFNLDNLKQPRKTFSKKLRFGFIGNLMPAKGAHILIQAFNEIRDNAAELKIYGKAISYKSIIGNYSARIKKMVVNKNTRFTGEFDNRDIENIFSEIDVLVVPSIWRENSPLIIQEAFIANTPVIASDIGGIPELITDTVDGLLFRAGDIEDLRGKMVMCIENPSLIQELKRNIRLPKDIKGHAKAIEGMYEDLLKKC